jgi:outer membrane receptor protein involved in Fe transport
LSLGERVDVQLAANYEFHDVASSFDPKVGWRVGLSESPTHSLFLRGSVQTTFRTPSLDDVNESPLSTLEWINQTGAYQTTTGEYRASLRWLHARSQRAAVEAGSYI